MPDNQTMHGVPPMEAWASRSSCGFRVEGSTLSWVGGLELEVHGLWWFSDVATFE